MERAVGDCVAWSRGTALRLLTGAALGFACAGRPPPSAAPSPASAGWVQRFVVHDGVRIEYRVRAGTGGLPVVLIPGMSGSAASYEANAALTAALGERTLVAISLRGRGASDCPDRGWAPADHHADVRAVIEAERLARYHLVGHSMGVAYGLGFALGRPHGEIASFVAADYFPAVIQVTEEWAQMVESSAPPRTYDPRFARHILREQGSADYAARLGELRLPMLAIFGTRSMEPEVEARYATATELRVLWIQHGHDTFTSADARSAITDHLARAERPRG